MTLRASGLSFDDTFRQYGVSSLAEGISQRLSHCIPIFRSSEEKRVRLTTATTENARFRSYPEKCFPFVCRMKAQHGCIDAVACLSRHPGYKLVSLTQSKTLLHSHRVPERMSTATLRDNLVLELKLAVSQSAGETSRARLEAFHSHVTALPKKKKRA